MISLSHSMNTQHRYTLSSLELLVLVAVRDYMYVSLTLHVCTHIARSVFGVARVWSCTLLWFPAYVSRPSRSSHYKMCCVVGCSG
jgi:hypothetical protein